MVDGWLDALSGIGDLIDFFLEIVLPSRARARRTKLRTSEDLTLKPEAHELCGISITTLMDYRSSAAQDTVQALKYDGSRHAAKLAAALLADYLREEIASIRAFSPRPVYIAPVPLHRSRERERGFNQIVRVLEELPNEFKDGTVSQIAKNILKRTRETPPQTHLSRSERLRNVQGAFEASGCDGAHLIVVDDVATTGATLSEICKVLKSAGATTSAIALARA